MLIRIAFNNVFFGVIVGLLSVRVLALPSENTDIIMGHPPEGKIDAEIRDISGAPAKALHPTNFIRFLDSQLDADGDTAVRQPIFYQWVTPVTPGTTEVSVDPGKWQTYSGHFGVSFKEVGKHLVAKFTPKTISGSNPDTGPTAYWATVAKVKDEGREVIITDPIGPVEPNTTIPEMVLQAVTLKLLSGPSWAELDQRYPGIFGPAGVGGSVQSPIVGSRWHVTYRCNDLIDPRLCSTPRFYKHQWLYESAPGQWDKIPGATNPEYVVEAAYSRKRIAVDVVPDYSILGY